jgi:hypothetical protein
VYLIVLRVRDLTQKRNRHLDASFPQRWEIREERAKTVGCTRTYVSLRWLVLGSTVLNGLLTRRAKESPRAVLYSREGCCLCAEAERHIRSVFGRGNVEVIDVTSDRQLEDRFVFRIPVLAVDGRVVAEGRISRADALDAYRRARGA